MINRRFFIFVTIFILIIALPVIIHLARQQQTLRSKASESDVSFFLDPQAASYPFGQDFDVALKLNAGTNNISQVQVKLRVNNPSVLKILSFTPSNNFSTVVRNDLSSAGDTVFLEAANINPAAANTGSQVLVGTLRLHGQQLGSSTVTYDLAVAASLDHPITTTGNIPGNYHIISTASPSPSPSASPNSNAFFFLQPQTDNKPRSQPFNVALKLNAGSNNISQVQVKLRVNNPSVLEILSFTPASNFATVISNDISSGKDTIFFEGANIGSSSNTGSDVNVGTIAFNGKQEGLSTVTYDTAVAASLDNQVTTSGNISGSYTISTGSPPPAGAPSDVTISSLPSCLDAGSSMSTAQKQAARISWNSSAFSFWVDMSPSSSFSPLYHKQVSGLTTDLTGFNKDNVFPETEIVISPNTNYFVRVFDEVNNLHSATIPVINIPQCSVTACTYQSTQVKFRLNDADNWQDTITVSQNQPVFIAGFHNNNTTNLPTDISITVVAPDYSSPQIPSGNKITFIPTLTGTYNVGATTNGQSGSACVAAPAGNLHVTPASPLPPPPVTTTDYRLAETTAALTSATWKPYTSDPFETTFTFADTLPGAKLVCVQFKGSDGTLSTPQCQTLDLVTAPEVTGCNLDFDQNGSLAFRILGKNFGSTKGTIESETVPLSTTGGSWTDNQVITGKTTSPPTGTDFNLTLTTSQGLSAEVVCSSVAQLSLGAKLFCPQVTPRDIPGVEVTIVEATTSGKTFKETSTLTKNGTISLKTKLIEGMGYKLALDVPKSIRKVVEFIAARDTTSVDITPTRTNRLALGDIFPLDGGDGAINSADKSEMNREWVIDKSAKTSGERPADLNIDSLVNSFDWSCMRQDFNAEDDPIPQAGPLSSQTINTFTPNVTTISPNSPLPTSSNTPTSTPSPTPSPTKRSGPAASPVISAANSCTTDLVDGGSVSGTVTTNVSGQVTDGSYSYSLWALDTKFGDTQLVSLTTVQPSTKVFWVSGYYYNNGPATLDCRIQTTPIGGTTIYSKKTTVQVNN